MTEGTQVLTGVRDAVARLDDRLTGFEARMDRRFDTIDRRFEAVDRRFEANDQRFEAVDRRFLEVERKVDRSFELLDAKMSRQFVWLVGIVMTMFASGVAAFATIISALLSGRF